MHPSDDMQGYLSVFAHSAVTVTLDALMFEDGTTAGADSSQSMAQIKGEIKAEHDLLRTLSIGDQTLAWSALHSASALHQAGDEISLSPSTANSTWYQVSKAQLARHLLRVASD